MEQELNLPRGYPRQFYLRREGRFSFSNTRGLSGPHGPTPRPRLKLLRLLNVAVALTRDRTERQTDHALRRSASSQESNPYAEKRDFVTHLPHVAVHQLRRGERVMITIVRRRLRPRFVKMMRAKVHRRLRLTRSL
jgi:hypothetical protein